MDRVQKLNAVSRLILFITLVCFVMQRRFLTLVTGAVTLAAVAFLFYVQQYQTKVDEPFTSIQLYDLVKDSFTRPTKQNPIMNPLLTEIDDDPTRPPAAPGYNVAVEADINKSVEKMVTSKFNDPNIDERLFRDLGDQFEFDRSMIQFHPMPNTRIPNDQEAFAKFCYGDMIACRDTKNNELACTRNMPYRWQNV
jgi:hypothetical protein